MHEGIRKGLAVTLWSVDVSGDTVTRVSPNLKARESLPAHQSFLPFSDNFLKQRFISMVQYDIRYDHMLGCTPYVRYTALTFVPNSSTLIFVYADHDYYILYSCR